LGTGIGLMVVEHATKAHNGKIEVVSVENEFTVFKLFIPLNIPKHVNRKEIIVVIEDDPG
jgi:signal transduction histidine kinase